MGKIMKKTAKILLSFVILVSILLPSHNAHFGKVEAATLHVWEKYETKKEEQYVLECSSGCSSERWYGDKEGYSDIKLDPYTGQFSYAGYPVSAPSSPYWVIDSYRGVVYSVGRYSEQYWGTTYYAEKKLVETKGNYLVLITGEKANEYPKDGKHSDGYWYVYKGLNNLPTVSLLTSNNQLLSEVPGYNELILSGSAQDPDNGDNISLKYSIIGVAGHQNTVFYNYTSNGSSKDFSIPLKINGTIPQGTHTIKVWAEDNKGGKSPEVSRSFTVDKTRPIISASPDKRENWDTTEVNINVSLSDALAGIDKGYYHLSTNSTPGTTWTIGKLNNFIVKINTEGEWYLHVKATDKAGNEDVKTYGVYRYFILNEPENFILKSTTTSSINYEWKKVEGHQYQLTLKNDKGTVLTTTGWISDNKFQFTGLSPNTGYYAEIKSKKYEKISNIVTGDLVYTDAEAVKKAVFEPMDEAIKITLDTAKTGNPADTQYEIKNILTGQISPAVNNMWINSGLQNDMSYDYMARPVNKNGKAAEWFFIGKGNTILTVIEPPIDWEDEVGGQTPIDLEKEFNPETICGKAAIWEGKKVIIVCGKSIPIEIEGVKNATHYAISKDGYGYSSWKELDDGKFKEVININEPGFYPVHVKFKNQYDRESESFVRNFLVDWIAPDVTSELKNKKQTATTVGYVDTIAKGKDNLSYVFYFDGSKWVLWKGQDIRISGIPLNNSRHEVQLKFSDLNGNVIDQKLKIWGISK